MACNIEVKEGSGIGVVMNGDHGNVGDIYINPLAKNVNKTFDLPNLIDSYHGREAETMQLDELFFTENKRKVVICGLPGFGKTELCKQYADYCLRIKQINKVFWVQADDLKYLENSLKGLRKSFEEYKDTRCLYIFDNALSRQSIFKYEPKQYKNHFTLINSVVEDFGHDVVPLRLDSVSLKSALEIFQVIFGEKYRQEDSSLYEELANTVDCVPLGLQIVAGCTRQKMNFVRDGFNLKDHITSVKLSQDAFLDKTIPASCPNEDERSIYGAFKISLEQINKQDLALTLLYMCSFTPPDKLYFRSNDCDTQLKLAIGLLVNFSFINYIDDKSIKIHKLTQTFLRYYLNSTNLIDKYYDICLTGFYKDSYIFKSVIEYADLSPQTVYNFYEKRKTDNIPVANNTLINLTYFGCIKSLSKIFQNNDAKSLISRIGLLHYAARYKHKDVFELFLNYVDIKTSSDVMHTVAAAKNLDYIKILIKRGADVNIKNKKGNTPLFTFVNNIYYTNTTTFDWNEVLATFQFDKKLTNNNTLLHLAVYKNNFKLVKVLISKYKININQRNDQNYTPLDCLIENFKLNYSVITDDDIVKITFIISLLLDQKPEINPALLDEYSEFLLMSSAIQHNKKQETLKWLLQQTFININSKNRENETALFTAASLAKLQAIQILVHNKINVNIVNNKNQTALSIFTNYITEKKHNINQKKVSKILDLLGTKEDAGYDFLHTIVIKAYPTLLSLIIKKYKCDVNKLIDGENTCLHLVCMGLEYLNVHNTIITKTKQKDIIETVKILKQFGALLNIQNSLGEIPLELLHRLKDEYNYQIDFLIPYLTLTTPTIMDYIPRWLRNIFVW